ncbi:MAG: fluoride efflux transporter CrcB [Spirochaetes bacterium]|nr:fluoride efflux transporter CrcB [Spirochaetota bacterium]
MEKILYIALGGSLGAVSRYAVTVAVQRFLTSFAPWGTLMVNASGCLIIGFLFCFVEEKIITPNMRFFIFTGFLGGYTTFSSYGLETFNLFRDGEFFTGTMNILLSNVLGIGFVFAGFFLGRALLNAIR